MFNFIRRKFHPGGILGERTFEVKLPEVSATEGKIDRYSSTWLFIKAWAETELIKAREQNDYQKTTELKTAALRGRIKLLKELIKLPEPTKRKQPAIDDQD